MRSFAVVRGAPRAALATLVGLVCVDLSLVALVAVAGIAGAVEPSAAVLARVPKALPGAPPLPAELRAQLAGELASRPPDYVPRTKNLREDGSPLFTNRLLLESSPYLGQHAHNPVNWYPWGEEAFATAKWLDVPVLVSIGYSTCHWCHVMEEESFDSPEVARYLNEHFIAIKVDREARPDIDAVYMAAIHAMKQRGGWPLNVWVTPDRKPFYAGTYFPPVDRRGRPGIMTVLRSIHEQYANEPERIDQLSARLAEIVQKRLEGAAADSTRVPDVTALKQTAAAYVRRIDPTWGGIGSGTKFPSNVPVRFLLRYHRRTGDARVLELVTLTLEKMAAGGMYDHVGGGFHRYSTDPRWLIPHFEKMLYDNALLALAYSEAWQATGREDFARIAREILRYVGREMTSPQGGFYSATDADSENPEGESEEGWFFTWTPAELEAALGAGPAAVVAAYYGVTPEGNLDGRSVLHAWREPEAVARELGIDRDELEQTLEAARARLYELRARRPAPLRDEKILVAWNGLMISAFARAGFAFGDPAATARAARAADFVLKTMRHQGRLRRVSKDGIAGGPAFLEDYAFFIAGLLDLYEADPDPRWLREAIALQATLEAHYADTRGGAYLRTADDHESLLARELPSRDGAIPSGNSVAALNLLRLAGLTGQAAYLERVTMLFSAVYPLITRGATDLPEMMLAVEHLLDTTKEVVVVRPSSGGEIETMLAPLRSGFVPNRVVSIVTEGDDLAAHATLVPLVSGKVARRGRVTAYVCEDQVCDFPTSDPAVFAKQLSKVKPID